MSATIVDQLIDSPFQDLLFEAEPQDLPDLFLLLIQDSTLWKRRIRSLRRQLVDQTLQPPDQITGLQPVLDAIGECRLWDALRETEITAEQVCEVADHPQALWLVCRTMEELLETEVLDTGTPPEDDGMSCSDLAVVRLQLVNRLISSQQAGSETAAASGVETRPASGAAPESDRLVDPLPWLLLWRQSLEELDFDRLQSAYQLVSRARERHQPGNSPLALSSLASYAAEALQTVNLPAHPLTVDFDADTFCSETARDLVLTQPNDSFSWQTELKQWLLNQDWQRPDELWAMKRPRFHASGQDVHRFVGKLRRELSQTAQQLRGPRPQQQNIDA